MHTILQDLRFALRQLRKSLGFTVIATITLGLGIGAATAVFSLVDTVLLRPLPFAQPNRLVALDTLARPSGTNAAAIIPTDTSYPNFFDWRDRAKSFEALTSYQGGTFTLSSGATPARRIAGMVVAADFFRTLGIPPVLGRSFTRSEELPGNRSVVISQALWRSALNGSPAALGQSIRLNDEVYFVVGVLPSGFQFPGSAEAEVWITPSLTQEGKNPSGRQRGWNQVNVLGRLRSGVSIDQARAEMQIVQRSLAAQYPDDNKNATAVSVVSELDNVVGDVQRPLHILFGAVCSLLLIACANVAGLLLTRTSARRSELAIRSALGATRVEIVRQLLIESLALAALGGLLGFALAAATLRLAPRFLPPDLPRLNELTLDARVFFFSVAASLLTGLLFGVLPAWRMSRLDPALALRDKSRGSTGSRSQSTLHSVLVVGETALGLILLVGAGLLIRSFNKLLNVDPGFNPHHVLTFRVAMPPKRFQDERLLQFVQQLQASFSAIPGVSQATYAFPLPLAGSDMSVSFSIDGRPSAPGDHPGARASVVQANFFTAMQMPLRRGRFFSSTEDRPSSPPVIIVNQAFADRYFPGEDALGKRIQSDLSATDNPQMREVVGIVQNVTRTSLTEQAQPEYYIPFAQVPLTSPVFALRVAGDPSAYIEPVRALVARQDASLPVYNVRTDLLTRVTAQQRFQTTLLSAFAAIALLLAAIGLYAVLSYMVAQRTMELGLRLALGAQRSSVLKLVLKRGLGMSLAGIALGLLSSLLLTRFVAALLFNIRALDVTTFAAMALLMLSVSAVSCLVPAYRASRLNPNDTLRQQ